MCCSDVIANNQSFKCRYRFSTIHKKKHKLISLFIVDYGIHAASAFGGAIQEEVLFLEDSISSNFDSVSSPSKPQIQPAVLRKDFPETWIWNDINEEG